MSVIARWTIEGLPGMDRELVNVSGPNIRFREQVKVVKAEDYDALAKQLEGAVDRIRDLEQALDRAADDLRSLGHFEMSERAYAPLGTEWGL